MAIPSDVRLFAIRLCASVCLSGFSTAFAQELPARPTGTEPSEPRPNNADVVATYDSRWMPSLALGAQFLPDYDENGRSSGLSKQQFFALMTVDGSFGPYNTERSATSGRF